jgi:hypothetical protein
MSEYQYYEFQTVDRVLNPEEVAELRKISTRAKITPKRFQNIYSHGDFSGDPLELMTRYFDAHVYAANWGTHRLMLRLPGGALDLQTVEPYAVEYSFDVHHRDDALILELDAEGENDELAIHWITDEEAEGWLPALLPLRAELAQGDTRALYLGWLAATGTLDDEDVVEPPVPPGLSELTPALRTLAEFLYIDEDLLAIAAAASPSLAPAPTEDDLQLWIAGLPPVEKDALLLQLAGDAGKARGELLRRFYQATTPQADSARPGERTVAELLAAAEERYQVRSQEEAERQAAERAAYLDGLVGKEAALWREIDDLIETKRPREYDQAVQILRDLSALADHVGEREAFAARLDSLRGRYAKRSSLLQRLDRADLLA